jgi:hypothetical protein
MPMIHAARWVLAVLCATALGHAQTPPPPASPTHPVTDDYHGTSIVDPYRWLEDARSPRPGPGSMRRTSTLRAIVPR